VTNELKIAELQREIGLIETEEDEANRYVRNLQKEEEESHEYLRYSLRKIEEEFEACRGDRHLTRLVEDKYRMLQEMERECVGFLTELHEKQLAYKYKCESDIDELRREMKRLQMEVV